MRRITLPSSPRAGLVTLTAALALAAAACGNSSTAAPADAGCVPRTCAQLVGQCGALDDGCGGPLACACPTGQRCGVPTPNRCSALADAGGGGADGGASDAGVADAGTEPKIGTACSVSSDCGGSPLLCTAGFCTRTCSRASQCQTAVERNGIYGGVYVCFPLGEGFASFCWPNGSGAACGDAGVCPRSGETCIAGRCQYPKTGAPGEPRDAFKCLRDADCRAGESCALYTNLDELDVRTDGLCLHRGEGEGARRVAGEPCDEFAQCGSRRCLVATAPAAGQCSALCSADAECPTGTRCTATALSGGALAEFSDQFVGSCNPWDGSGQTCASNAACPSGETCFYQRWFDANATHVIARGACRRPPNPAAAATGASCRRDADCKSGQCLFNTLSQRGYCTDTCWGGDSECPSGTACRPRLVDGRDPATNEDDVRVPHCVETGAGAVCDFTPGCRSCTSDAQCAASLGWTCADGICRDALGRCANPCYTGCALTDGGVRGGCPVGSTCKTTRQNGADITYCERTAGGCARLPVDQILTYDHARCGDSATASPQQDLCYFHSRQSAGATNTDVFVCGQACTASCPNIAVDGGTLATACRTTYEFGVNSDGGISFGGYSMSPQQCAPANVFVGQMRPDGGI